jgi:hypothetical protein
MSSFKALMPDKAAVAKVSTKLGLKTSVFDGGCMNHEVVGTLI